MKKTLLILAFSFMLAFVFSQKSGAQTGKSKTSGVPSVRAHNVFPMEEGLVDAHGVLIYYTIVGRGAPLMIVHGGPGASHDYFLPYLLPLARPINSSSSTNAVPGALKNWKPPASTR